MMAARKRTSSRSGANGGADARAFGVVVEQLRSEFKVVAEAVMGLDARMTAGFQGVDRRFEGVDRRFDAIDQRFDAADRRFDALDQRVDRVDRELALVKTAVLDTNREVKALRSAVGDLDAHKADRGELPSPPAR
jgi:hypothetical protein